MGLTTRRIGVTRDKSEPGCINWWIAHPYWSAWIHNTQHLPSIYIEREILSECAFRTWWERERLRTLVLLLLPSRIVCNYQTINPFCLFFVILRRLNQIFNLEALFFFRRRGWSVEVGLRLSAKGVETTPSTTVGKPRCLLASISILSSYVW